MLMLSSTGHQTNFLGTDLLLQLDPHDPLLRLVQVIPGRNWTVPSQSNYPQGQGRPS
ncbi:MAG: IS5/IS1182 family transposase, partial [Methyloglobulus sp.]|nr:IS5/IS1182 family transposase [Methyloglobulus sp.]